MKYRIYQVSIYGGRDMPPKKIEKTDVSDHHYILPNGDIINKAFHFIMDPKHFEIELVDIEKEI